MSETLERSAMIARDGRKHPVHPTIVARSKPLRKNGRCIAGHDKLITGVRSDGACLQCTRERKRQERGTLKIAESPLGSAFGAATPSMRRVDFYKPICPRGHDKRITGVDSHYGCLACRACRKEQKDAAYWRNYRRSRKCKEAGLPEGMVVARGTALPKLREIRLRAGLTQKEMAARIGCSAGFVCRLEAGRQKVGRVVLRNILGAISETGKGFPKGRYVGLLRALVEAERRGMPTGKTVAEILPESTLRTGSLLRWAERLGLAEKFDGAPKGAPKTSKTTWLITDEGRALIGGVAACEAACEAR